MRVYNDIKCIFEPPAEKGQCYIYVLENQPQGYIKIGRTMNPAQRFKSLSGSNNGGNYIKRVAISPMTYIYNIEKICHEKFSWFRIDGTEYFKKIKFEDVVNYVDYLFSTNGFTKCTEIRIKRYAEHPEEIPKFLDKELQP